MSEMVIDPATGAFLEGMKASGGKPLYELTIEEAGVVRGRPPGARGEGQGQGQGNRQRGESKAE